MRRIKKVYGLIAVILIIVLAGCKQSEDATYKKLVKNSLELPKNYTVELAVENGDVVDVHGDITNIEKLDKFVEDVSNGKKAFVRTVRYTIEGDPIIYTLYYNGETIKGYIDNTRDEWGNPLEITESNYSKIEVKEKNVDDVVIHRSYYLLDMEGKEADIILAQAIKP